MADKTVHEIFYKNADGIQYLSLDQYVLLSAHDVARVDGQIYHFEKSYSRFNYGELEKIKAQRKFIESKLKSAKIYLKDKFSREENRNLNESIVEAVDNVIKPIRAEIGENLVCLKEKEQMHDAWIPRKGFPEKYHRFR